MALTTTDKQLPYLALQKEPALTMQELYIKYPDGGEFGWYAFVDELKSFAYWDVNNSEWKKVKGDKGDKGDKGEATEAVYEILSENSDGRRTYQLSQTPFNKGALSVFVNGILREGVELVGALIILPFSPATGSVVSAKYFTWITPIDPIIETEKVNILWAFMQIFIQTNKILTTDEGELLLTDSGEYIEVDIL